MGWNLSFREIEYIVTIAAEGSITKAAQKLFIAQPSLSQAVKKIEQTVGVKLFTRVRNKVNLTYEGELFVESGIKTIKIFHDLENKINDIANLNCGRIILGIPFLLGSYIFPRLGAAYHSRFPNVDIKLVEGTSSELETMILNGAIDLAIIPLPLKKPDIAYHAVFSSKMVLQIPSGHRLNQYAYKKPGHPERFEYLDIRLADGEPFLLGYQGQRIRTVNEIIFQKANITPQVIFTSTSIDTIRRIAATGVGLTIVPEHYLNHLGLIPDTNYYFLEDEYSYPWTIVAAYYSGSYLSVAVQELINTLDIVFGDKLSPDAISKI